MRNNILDAIIKHKYSELDDLKTKYSKQIKNPDIENKRSNFKKAFTEQEHVKIMAEIKPASPSEGEIFNPTKENIQNIAKIYSNHPIGAISVLTDKKYFNGSYENIALVKEVTSTPVLCKEFIVDKSQIALAKHFGADAILLIAEALTEKIALELYNYAKDINLDVLFECHSVKKLEILIKNDINIIGINNRDLNTMKVDIQKCLNLRDHIPEDRIIIAESGFKTSVQIKLLEDNKFNGVLIGTSILKSDNIDQKLKEVVNYYG